MKAFDELAQKPQPKTEDGKHYKCAVCLGSFGHFEVPLFLEEMRVVHARCWMVCVDQSEAASHSGLCQSASQPVNTSAKSDAKAEDPSHPQS